MEYELRTKADFRVSEWSGGKTWELLLLPESGSYQEREFDLRISSASVDLEKSKFTPLPGFDRLICPLDGELTLFHQKGKDDTISKAELKPYQFHFFSGGWQTESVGKVQDFNVMCRTGFPVKVDLMTPGTRLPSQSLNPSPYMQGRQAAAFFTYEGSRICWGPAEELELPAFSLLLVPELSESSYWEVVGQANVIAVSWLR
jgi:environmental stress-induced protein Ves